jgi:WD40 repeat protein
MRLSQRWAETATKADIFATRVAPDGSLVACGLSNGQLALHSFTTGRLSYTLEQSPEHFAVTSVRFNARSPKTLIAASADGIIREWFTRNATVNWSVTEAPNQVFSLDISPHSDIFATAGLDKAIRVYDYPTRTIRQILSGEEGFGHTNRIFSLLFHPTDANLLFSAGWDDSIQTWDLRMGGPVHAMFGAHVCSDTLDIHGNWLASGSWRTKDQVQLWDLRTFTADRVLRWRADRQCLVYALRFSPRGDEIAFGGSGATEVRFMSMKTFEQTADPLPFPSTVYSLAFSADGRDCIIGTQKGTLACFQRGDQ